MVRYDFLPNERMTVVLHFTLKQHPNVTFLSVAFVFLLTTSKVEAEPSTSRPRPRPLRELHLLLDLHACEPFTVFVYLWVDPCAYVPKGAEIIDNIALVSLCRYESGRF